MFVDFCLALGKNLLFLLVEQSPHLCILATLLSKSPRPFSNRSPRSFGHRRRRQTDRQIFSLRVMALYSVSFTKHPRVHRHRIRRPRECVGLDRSLLEAVGVALITCVEVDLVKRIHTVFGRNAQHVVYEIQMREEMEGVRQEGA